MAGSGQRPGSVRRSTSKKGPTAGSGGRGRKALQGKGPTPKAEDREYHAAHRRKRSADRQQAPRRPPARRPSGSTEYVAGRNSVVEALRAQIPASTLYVAVRIDSDDRVRESLAMAAERSVAVLETPRAEMDRLTGGALHQGLALQVPAYDYAHPDDLLAVASAAGVAPLLVALDGVTDPRNLGAVVRSAAAFGAHGVVVPQRRAAGMSAGAWKASAGAAARLPVARAVNLTRALESYRGAGCFVVGLDAGGDVALPDLAVVDEPVVLVVGSEGKGLSRLVRATCDVVASVPMATGTESLNAGVAAGVALYEVARRRAARS